MTVAGRRKARAGAERGVSLVRDRSPQAMAAVWEREHGDTQSEHGTHAIWQAPRDGGTGPTGVGERALGQGRRGTPRGGAEQKGSSSAERLR